MIVQCVSVNTLFHSVRREIKYCSQKLNIIPMAHRRGEKNQQTGYCTSFIPVT